MTAIRKKYSKEFKLEAIRMYENGDRTITEVEQALGITAGLLWKWKENLKNQPQKEEAFPGNGRLTDTEARIRQLERENALLKEDKEILKKVLTMYSKDGR
ncbi:MAG: transposase [Chloroflexi bacterium]|nr:transposase [Chloroflexota bacterium]